MCPQLQHLTVLASHTDPFAGGSYGGDECGARKKATTDWPSGPSEMSNRSSLKVILYLPTLCSKELSLEKTKVPPSSSSFCAPVATIHTLIVPSALPETNVSASTYSSLVTDLLKNSS